MTIEQIDRLAFDVEQAKAEYLRRNGWTHTCNVPGSFWVWTKTQNGQSLMGGADLAVSMQKAIDYFNCLCDDEHASPACPVHGDTIQASWR